MRFRPPWFLGLWRISRPPPDPGYAVPRRALSASLSGARHGLVPMRKGQLGHLTAAHLADEHALTIGIDTHIVGIIAEVDPARRRQILSTEDAD